MTYYVEFRNPNDAKYICDLMKSHYRRHNSDLITKVKMNGNKLILDDIVIHDFEMIANAKCHRRFKIQKD